MELLKYMLMVSIGAVLGANFRFLLSYAAQKYFEISAVYWVTFIINILGSLILGYAVAKLSSGNWGKTSEMILAIGFCGSFTTFSTFSLEALELLKGQHYMLFAIYVGGSFILGILAVLGGMNLGQL